MTSLSNKLKKFYHRENKSIIFTNGLSLNKMAHKMFEIGCKIDPSSLSRVINGKRLFTFEQLDSFSTVLNLPTKDRISLEKTLSSAIVIRKGGIDLSNYSNLLLDIKNIEVIYKSIVLMRKSGDLEGVIRLSNFYKEVLSIDRDIYKENLKYIALINSEKIRAIGLSTRPEYAIPLTKRIAIETIEIAEHLKDRNLTEFAYMNYGGMFYVGQDYKESIEFLTHKRKIVSKKMQLQFSRTLLNDFSLIKDKQGFYKEVSIVEKLLSSASNYGIDHIVSVTESMAKGLSRFGEFKEAYKLLDGTKKLSPNPFYESQIYRGKLSIILDSLKNGYSIDFSEADELVNKYNDPKLSDFTRHKEQVKNIYEQIKKYR